MLNAAASAIGDGRGDGEVSHAMPRPIRSGHVSLRARTLGRAEYGPIGASSATDPNVPRRRGSGATRTSSGASAAGAPTWASRPASSSGSTPSSASWVARSRCQGPSRSSGRCWRWPMRRPRFRGRPSQAWDLPVRHEFGVRAGRGSPGPGRHRPGSACQARDRRSRGQGSPGPAVTGLGPACQARTHASQARGTPMPPIS